MFTSEKCSLKLFINSSFASLIGVHQWAVSINLPSPGWSLVRTQSDILQSFQLLIGKWDHFHRQVSRGWMVSTLEIVLLVQHCISICVFHLFVKRLPQRIWSVGYLTVSVTLAADCFCFLIFIFPLLFLATQQPHLLDDPLSSHVHLLCRHPLQSSR
jgi:hypothetical protein